MTTDSTPPQLIQPGDTVMWDSKPFPAESGKVTEIITRDGVTWASITIHTPGRPGTAYTTLPVTLLTRVHPDNPIRKRTR